MTRRELSQGVSVLLTETELMTVLHNRRPMDGGKVQSGIALGTLMVMLMRCGIALRALTAILGDRPDTDVDASPWRASVCTVHCIGSPNRTKVIADRTFDRCSGTRRAIAWRWKCSQSTVLYRRSCAKRGPSLLGEPGPVPRWCD